MATGREGRKVPRVKSRLGWLGPVLVLVGLAVGGLGVWFMFHARPRAGAIVDLLPLDGEWALVIRREATSDRGLLELVSTKRGVEWQALVPRYAGRPGTPGLAVARAAVSVRIVRTRPEVWAMSTRDATKLGGISLAGYVTGTWLPDGPSTVVSAGDGSRSFEVVDGTEGATIVAIDLEHGAVLWHREIGGPIRALTMAGDDLEVVTATGPGLVLDPATGTPLAGRTPGPRPAPGALSPTLRFVDGALVRGDSRFPWPPGARPPLPYHLTGRYLWLIEDGRLAVLDTETFEIVGSHPVR